MPSIAIFRRLSGAALCAGACCLSLAGCWRESAASEPADRLNACLVGTLEPEERARQPERGTLDVGSCPTHDGSRYADYAISLTAGWSYLVVATDRADTTGRHPRHRRFDVSLLSGAASPKVLLDGSLYEGRDPAHAISQLFFVAPTTGGYTVRVRGHGPDDRGAYAVAVRACGGGTLTVGVATSGTLTPASCLEEMNFGADSGYADLWTLHLDPGESVLVRVGSPTGIPLYLRIVGPALTKNEADGDVDRLQFTAHDGGDYTVLVGQTAFDRRPYPYTIRVERRGY